MKIFNPNIAPTAASQLDQLNAPEKAEEKQIQLERLRKACKDFESIFISYILKNMRKTTEESGLFGEGLGGDIYQEIFDEKLAETMANSNQLKLGDLLYSRYSKLVAGDIKPNQPIQKLSEVNTQPNGQFIGKSESRPATKFEPLELPPIEITERENRVSLYDSLPKFDISSAMPDATAAAIPMNSEYDHIISEAADRFGVKPSLIKAVIKHESGGNPQAVSAKGAKGLMQLLDSTATMLGVTDPFNPAQNIMAGARYLSMLIRKFDGDLTRAIASYNAGPGTVERYGGIPPYPETRQYVENVLSSMRED